MASMDGLHILVVPSWWPSPEKPMSGVFFTDYVRAFSDAGAKVGVIFPDLVSLRGLGSGASIPLRPRLTWESLDATPVLRIRGLHTALGRPAWQMGRFRRWLRRGLAEYRERHGEPHLIHAMIALPAGWACTHLNDPLASRVVLTEETGPFSLVMTPRAGESFVRAAMAKATHVVTVSEHARADMRAHGIDREILICGNPVARDFIEHPLPIRPQHSPPRALFVGRMVIEKGLIDLADALEGCDWARGVAWHFAGDGPALDEVRSRFARLGVPCVFHGRCERPRVIQLMADSDFFVFPTHGETFGSAVAEALCMGLPVVTTRGTACAEFVTGDNGVLIEMKDATSLSIGVQALNERISAFRRTEIAGAARRRFDGSRVAVTYDRLFRPLIDAR